MGPSCRMVAGTSGLNDGCGGYSQPDALTTGGVHPGGVPRLHVGGEGLALNPCLPRRRATLRGGTGSSLQGERERRDMRGYREGDRAGGEVRHRGEVVGVVGH